MERKKKNFKLGVLVAAALIIVGLLGWFLLDRFEGEKPELSLELISPYISQSQALPGKPRNSRKLQSSPHLELLDPRFPSASPAKKAVNPTTSHLCRSKGWKRAAFIRFHARPRGAKKAILSIFIPPRIFSHPDFPHIYYVKTAIKIRSPGIYIIFLVKSP